MSFDCAITRAADTVVVSPSGDIDMKAAPELRQVLQRAVAVPEVRQIEVDMGQVTFLDSSGLGVLVASYRAAEERGISLRLRELRPMVRMVLEVTNLVDLLVGDGTRQAEQAHGGSVAP